MSSRYHSQLYRQLLEVDPRDPQRVIRMYEEREREIGHLDVEEYFDLTVSYAEALFATGAYRQHLLMIEPIIKASITDNLSRATGVEGDVFEHLLFRKAVSAYRLQDFDLANHVAQELIRINPDRELYVRFLRIIFFHQQNTTLQFGRGGFILCILLAAAAITLQWLLVRPFFSGWETTVRKGIMLTFVLGVGVLLGAYLLAHFRAHRRAFGFRKSRQNK